MESAKPDTICYVSFVQLSDLIPAIIRFNRREDMATLESDQSARQPRAECSITLKPDGSGCDVPATVRCPSCSPTNPPAHGKKR